MKTFTIIARIAKFYPYRSVKLMASIWVELDNRDIMWLQNYIRRMGYKFDNHICWKNEDGMCFEYSDRKLGIGLEIIEQKW